MHSALPVALGSTNIQSIAEICVTLVTFVKWLPGFLAGISGDKLDIVQTELIESPWLRVSVHRAASCWKSKAVAQSHHQCSR